MKPRLPHVFAIRHKPNGSFLPAGRRRGFTHDEPTLAKPPRLFLKVGPAKCALKAWLQGEWHEKWEYSFEGDPQDVYPCPDGKPHNRKAEDMEIVEFRLMEVKQ